MNLENQKSESPLEKAKRLKAEKGAKDSSKRESGAQAKTEKLDALNNSKQDLENKLDEINAQIEASRSDARETRDTMKEADLDKDEDFKEEYGSTISEVAGNLNELRNERNKIKAELEQINSDIENFEVNEVIAEGKEATQEAVESIKQEDGEAVAQVESYPGADAQDVEAAKEVVDETSKEVGTVAENAKKEVGEVLEKANDESLKELEDFNNFAKTLSLELFPKPSSQLKEFINQRYKDLKPDSEEYNSKWSEISTAFNYKKVLENPYVKQYQPNLSLEDYKQNKKEISEKREMFESIEKNKGERKENRDNQKEWDSQTVESFKDAEYREKAIEKFKKSGKGEEFNYHNINLLFENGLLSVNEIAQGLSNNEQDLAKDIKNLSPEIAESLKDQTITRGDRNMSFNDYIKYTYSSKRDDFNKSLSGDMNNYVNQINDFSNASELLPLFKSVGEPIDKEFVNLWNDKFSVIKEKVTQDNAVWANFCKKVNLKFAISFDKKVLSDIVLPGLKRSLKSKDNFLNIAVKTLEDMVDSNLVSREEADEMYKEALI